MKIKCKYCDTYISDTDEKCPNCGAVNAELKRVGEGVPKTIEELKQWYIDHNLPPEEITRFFIGKDIKEPRAFGIYYDEFSGNYVVYKNKDTGERAVRYEGKDQIYAVNELYLKLKEEIQNQKNSVRRNYRGLSNADRYMNGPLFTIHFISVFVSFIFMRINPIAPLFMFLSINPGIFIMVAISIFIKNDKVLKIINKAWHIGSFIIFFLLLIIPFSFNVYTHKNDGYYKDNNSYYYNYGSDWYLYDNNNWNSYDGDTSKLEYIDDDYSISYDITDFKDSSYYKEDNNFWGSSSSSSSDSWDSSSSWDSNDSWDSGGTDWSSDW